jgi:putative transposase
MKRRGLDQLALRALMKATHLLGLVLGQRLAEMRNQGDAKEALFAQVHEQTLQVSLYQEALDVNRTRWDKLPERQRPHHSPESRFRILRLMHLWALSHDETARMFSVSPSTIARWQAEFTKDPDKTAIGSLLKPVPPVRRYADSVRHLVQAMAIAGFPGDRSIAQTLARAGWKIARRTVGRIRREKPVSQPEPPRQPGRAVRARYPNHVWMADLTEVPSLFRIFSLKLAVILDTFSRLPLAFRVFTAEPSAQDIADLFAHAASRHGAPKHFVSDQGPQFTASRFRERLKALSVRQRFGAIGKTGSIALIERLWRTLKERLRLVSLRPGHAVDLERRVHVGLVYYAHFRPHQGLGGATPAEVYLGLTPLHHSAVHPPRGRPGETVPGMPSFEIACLDREHNLPFLRRKAA